MNTIVQCFNEDEPSDVVEYGPFEDTAWAEAWIIQHNHNPYLDEPGGDDDPVGELSPEEYQKWEDEVLRPREEDEQHWCLNASFSHQIVTLIVPAFDPTTLPVQK